VRGGFAVLGEFVVRGRWRGGGRLRRDALRKDGQRLRRAIYATMGFCCAGFAVSHVL
jgi:hypothetical protein